jgi:hypothetical protein
MVVKDRSRWGLAAAMFHATSAPRSCPTRCCSRRVAPLIQRENTITCGCEQIHRGKPGPSALRETVQQHDRLPVWMTALWALELHIVVSECIYMLFDYIRTMAKINLSSRARPAS